MTVDAKARLLAPAEGPVAACVLGWRCQLKTARTLPRGAAWWRSFIFPLLLQTFLFEIGMNARGRFLKLEERQSRGASLLIIPAGQNSSGALFTFPNDVSKPCGGRASRAASSVSWTASDPGTRAKAERAARSSRGPKCECLSRVVGLPFWKNQAAVV